MTLVAAAERAIDAPAGDLYTYVADFTEHHPHILPSAFSDFTVEAGGVGVGTVTSSRFRVGGRTQTIRTRVTRAVPGRLVEEVVIDQPMTTAFTFVPGSSGTTVRIETQWSPQRGLAGLLERLFAPRMIAKVYAEELQNLEAYAARRAQAD
jgi:Polyketide cyclase / dehydrase and lipid transport